MKYIVYSALYLLSLVLYLIPNFLMRAIAYLLAVVAHKVIGYRVKVVRSNLERSFPEKSVEERRKIEKRFYLFLVDLFFETLCMFWYSKKQMESRCKIVNIELLDQLTQKYGFSIIASAHYGNWEYSSSMKLGMESVCTAVYYPLKTEGMDLFFQKIRSKFGSVTVQRKDVLKHIVRSRKSGDKVAIGLIGDQSPMVYDESYSTMFLNQVTGVVMGADKLARKLNAPVVFVDIKIIKRGYYQLEFVKVTEDPKSEEPNAIAETCTRYLEDMIRREPSIWLWSHRRWKRKRELSDDIPEVTYDKTLL